MLTDSGKFGRQALALADEKVPGVLVEAPMVIETRSTPGSPPALKVQERRRRKL